MSQSDAVFSVIMPVFNEENTIAGILEKVLARPEAGEIIVIDDASRDNTRERLEAFRSNPRIKLLSQNVNQGKGAAVIRGIGEATKPFVIIQDADFEYSPSDYPILLEPLLSGKADVVYGSRFMGTPGPVRYFRHEMGNKVLTFASNCFSDIHLTDMETCYKAFRREVVQNINLESKRFGIEVEITAKVARARVLSIYEIPISYNPRKYNEGKKITWKDGIAAFCHIVKYNLFQSSSSLYKRPWAEIPLASPKN
ncbi:MAG: glycosyl transferase [Lentisphaerae bacterium GWF2_52_8]|nr:MAG: glycosyl transferase [Lentisphaerae bacterium GWF2_52_8]